MIRCRYVLVILHPGRRADVYLSSQWARERRQAEADREGDFGPEDYFDSVTRRRDDDEDDFAETMLLVVVCIMVSALIYVRGRWVERIRREAQQQEQQQEQQQQQQQQGADGQAPAPAPRLGDPPQLDWQPPVL